MRIESNAFQVAADLNAVGVAAGVRAHGLVRHYGALLQTRVMAHASKPRTGPPGPRLQTGDYVRSIGLTFGLVGGNPVATVGTNRPQARRLEFGFVGQDSRGAVYHQPPYGHFGPALDETAPDFVAAVAALVP